MLSGTTSLLFQYTHCAVLQIWLHIFLWDYLICLNPDTPDCKLKEQWDIICFFSHQMLQFSSVQFSSVQSLSRVQLFAAPWISAHQASLSITNSQRSLKLTSIELVMPSSRLILCQALLLLPPISPSIRVFSNESTLRMKWLKYWSFSFSISPSNEYLGLISFRIDWLDLLAIQGLSRVFFNTTIQKHQFFGAQLSL